MNALKYEMCEFEEQPEEADIENVQLENEIPDVYWAKDIERIENQINFEVENGVLGFKAGTTEVLDATNLNGSFSLDETGVAGVFSGDVKVADGFSSDFSFEGNVELEFNSQVADNFLRVKATDASLTILGQQLSGSLFEFEQSGSNTVEFNVDDVLLDFADGVVVAKVGSAML